MTDCTVSTPWPIYDSHSTHWRNTRPSPDAIIVSGDLANGGELDSYRRLRAVLDDARDRFGVPVLAGDGKP